MSYIHAPHRHAWSFIRNGKRRFYTLCSTSQDDVAEQTVSQDVDLITCAACLQLLADETVRALQQRFGSLDEHRK